jgi:AraC family transcriptional regulator, regulatory protein of adaptative response / methylated-DNA-[protein]-cysteine methyltransferase
MAGAATVGRHAVTREVLAVTVRPCPLGVLLVASSPAGIAAILLGDEAETLVDDLSVRFPGARLVTDGSTTRDAADLVAGWIDEPRDDLALPLDMRGTAFQRRVWEALRTIPVGRTATYAAIAQELGMPAAVRAVAGACAANAHALVIPCHRVVRSDGTLSGYRWGVERKRQLLGREAAVTPRLALAAGLG